MEWFAKGLPTLVHRVTYWGASTGTSNEELLLHDLLRVGPMRCLPWHVSAQPLLQPHGPVDLLSEEEVTTPHQAPLSPRQPDAPCKSTSSKSMVDRMFPSPAVRCLGPSFNLPLVSRYMPAPGSGGGGMDPALPAGAWPAPPARTAPAKLLDSGVWLVRDPQPHPNPTQGQPDGRALRVPSQGGEGHGRDAVGAGRQHLFWPRCAHGRPADDCFPPAGPVRLPLPVLAPSPLPRPLLPFSRLPSHAAGGGRRAQAAATRRDPGGPQRHRPDPHARPPTCHLAPAGGPLPDRPGRRVEAQASWQRPGPTKRRRREQGTPAPVFPALTRPPGPLAA